MAAISYIVPAYVFGVQQEKCTNRATPFVRNVGKTIFHTTQRYVSLYRRTKYAHRNFSRDRRMNYIAEDAIFKHFLQVILPKLSIYPRMH
jgi:hypothetical protein